MTKTVSHHKTWIARAAGLFILTALAAVYFAFPMLSMAANKLDPQNLNVKKLQNATNVKVTFVGPVNSGTPADLNASSGALNIVRFSTFPFKALEKGEWIGVSIQDKDPQSASVNQTFAWTCTIFNIQNNQVTCSLGRPLNSLLANATLMNRLQGKLVSFTVQPDANGTVTIPAASTAGSGWGSTVAL